MMLKKVLVVLAHRMLLDATFHQFPRLIKGDLSTQEDETSNLSCVCFKGAY